MLPVPAPRWTVDHLASRALTRLRAKGPAPVSGDVTAVFELELDAAGVVTSARYRCSRSCVTLLALCEAAALMVEGRPISEAATTDSGALLERVPGIPPSKAGRAVIASAALTSAARHHTRNERMLHP